MAYFASVHDLFFPEPPREMTLLKKMQLDISNEPYLSQQLYLTHLLT